MPTLWLTSIVNPVVPAVCNKIVSFPPEETAFILLCASSK